MRRVAVVGVFFIVLVALVATEVGAQFPGLEDFTNTTFPKKKVSTGRNYHPVAAVIPSASLRITPRWTRFHWSLRCTGPDR